MKKLLLILLLTATTVMAAPPVTLVVPNPPGGFTDTFGRSISRYLSVALQQDFVVVNRGGADGRVATDFVVAQPANGSHILIASSGTTLFNKVLLAKVVNDYTVFDNMVPMVRVPLMFAVSNKSGVTSFDEFLKLARSTKLNCAGSAASNGFAGRYIMKKYNLEDVQFVPFKGSGDMIPQLISGNLDCGVDSLLVLLPLHKEQRVRSLAVSSQGRHPAAPGMSLFSDLAPGFTFYSWAGISITKATPQAEKDRVFAALRGAAKDPTHRAAMTALGLEIVDNPTTDPTWLNSEYQRYESIRQQIGLSKID
jgi:tripartite-type tricarboxylate transporter receptor subunit TctC